MILPVYKYGEPALRKKGMRIESVTPEIRQLIDDMLQTMYDAAGIGLAAQQVGQALQLTVLDVREVKDRPSTLQIEGKASDVSAFMPLVLINPEITTSGNPATGPEGCLSFPEMYADITRPESVHVKALNAQSEPIEFTAGGLLSRAIQHEVDHLNGILFIDRMPSATKRELQPDLDRLMAKTKAAQTR